MRRIVVAIMGTLSGLVLLFSYHTSRNEGSTLAAGPFPAGTPTTPSSSTPTPPSTSGGSVQAAPSPSPNAGSGSSPVSGTFTGSAVPTRWGPVQVQITVSGGKITAAQAVQSPQGNQRDLQINAYALPVLGQEVTQAQSAQIDAVSGATVTSDGYIQSLQSAIDQAHLP